MYIWVLFLEKFVYLVVKIKKFKKCKRKQKQNKIRDLLSELVQWSFICYRRHYQQRANFLSFSVFEPRPLLFSKLVCQNNNNKNTYINSISAFFSKRILKSKIYCRHQRTIFVRTAISRLIHMVS